MTDFSFVRYDKSFKEELYDFLIYDPGWNTLKNEEKKRKFEWIYGNPPYTKIPITYLALDNNKIVGHRVFILQKFMINNEFLFGIPTGGLIHPNYRRMGLFSKIIDFSMKDLSDNTDVKLILSLSPNAPACKALQKNGYLPIGTREKIYLLSPKNFFKRIIISNFEKKFMDYSYKLKNLEINITNDLRMNEIIYLMSIFNNCGKLRNVRDSQFYEWRFRDSPYDMLYIYVYECDEMVGFLSLEKQRITFYSRYLEYYILIEYGYINKYYFEKLLEIIHKLPIPAIMAYTFTRSIEEKLIFRKYGFLDSNNYMLKLVEKILNTDRILDTNLPGAMIKPVSKKIKDNSFILDEKDIRLEKNWSLFRSDVH